LQLVSSQYLGSVVERAGDGVRSEGSEIIAGRVAGSGGKTRTFTTLCFISRQTDTAVPQVKDRRDSWVSWKWIL